jgi:hypothetical protein
MFWRATCRQIDATFSFQISLNRRQVAASERASRNEASERKIISRSSVGVRWKGVMIGFIMYIAKMRRLNKMLEYPGAFLILKSFLFIDLSFSQEHWRFAST